MRPSIPLLLLLAISPTLVAQDANAQVMRRTSPKPKKILRAKKQTTNVATLKRYSSKADLARRFKLKPRDLEKPVRLSLRDGYYKSGGNTIGFSARQWSTYSTMRNSISGYASPPKPGKGKLRLEIQYKGPIQRQKRIVECRFRTSGHVKITINRTKTQTIDGNTKSFVVSFLVDNNSREDILAFEGTRAGNMSLVEFQDCTITPYK